MSLIIITYVPEGIVMASDSRQSIVIESTTPNGIVLPKIDTINSDSVYKTYLLSKKDKYNNPLFEIGVSSFGQDLLGGVSIASHIKRFSEKELADADDVSLISKKLVKFFRESYPTADTGFHVAGYKIENKASIPYVYYCHVARNIFDQRRNIKLDGNIAYGATWSGQADIITGLINPIFFTDKDGKQQILKAAPPIAWDAMPLQDAIDFSIFAIRTTIDTIRFQARPKNVGGPIDVLVITPDGARWIQRKELKVN
jgi:hypothetical protein